MKKIIKIFIVIIICVLLLSQVEIYADNETVTNLSTLSPEKAQEQAGIIISSYARNFWEKNRDAIMYCPYWEDGGLVEHRRVAYLYNQTQSDGYIHLECVGWVTYAIWNSLHIEDSTVIEAGDGYIGPNGNHSSDFYVVASGLSYDQVLNSDIKQGDVIANPHHVMIYVGDGEIIHSINHPLAKGKFLDYGANPNHSSSKYCSGIYDSYAIVRITPEAAKRVTNATPGGDIHNLGNGSGGSSNWGSNLRQTIVDFFELDEELDKFRVEANPPEDRDFYYKGLATEKSKETITPTKDNDENDRITKFLSWAVSMMVTGVRGVFVGWANIIQIGATQYVAEMAGEQTSFDLKNMVMDSSEELKKQMEESLTVEKMVYNKVPLFDVNVFSDTGTGSKDSLSGVVKTMTANWYYIVRTSSIIVLLIVLIYLGIKFAISTSVESKATVKEMLFNWLVSFIVVYFMQYLILFGIKLNETFVNILASMGEKLNLYQEVRTLTYSTEIWKGIVATILYLALVWYLIKFIIIYFKRLFITVILIILAPMTAAKYAYDKIKGGKNDTSLMLWVKEFSFSVMMQTVHALTYTIFVSIAINMAKNGEATIATIIISLVFFNFMVKGERLIKDILKLVGSEGGSDFGDVSIRDIEKYAGWPTLLKKSRKLQVLRKLASPVTSIGGWAMNKAGRQIENAYVKLHKSELVDQYGIDFDKSKKTEIDKKIESALRQQYRMKVSTIKSSIKAGTKTLGGMGQVFLSIPIFVTDSPVVGMENMLMGLNTIWHAAGEPIKGYKKFKSKKQYKSTSKAKSIIKKLSFGGIHLGLTGLTGGLNFAFKKYKNIFGQKSDIINNFNPEQIRLLVEAKKSEQRLMGMLKQTRFKEFKGYNSENASELEKSLASSYEEKLLSVIEDSQKTLKTRELEGIIKAYQKRTRKN